MWILGIKGLRRGSRTKLKDSTFLTFNFIVFVLVYLRIYCDKRH